ncbi:ABC transporter ATP-binding protein [Candidatus Mycoplasma mahonii]|uniref:ABC transporter ATP-binding protein n=1 Tax=Candidatus Mycoplasma mahonii TaxID=3004105 RepID=UPI0026E9E3F1|nr:ABC transporter ATP-binding protein [Candidatus Mycoplasma mahonii]WKX02257.1 ABC transporter ATP-binding protein [Candidatus Mycoplasma mahonii]
MVNKIIEFVDLTKKFGKIIANDSINMSINKGEIHAIIGENGAGKSTLMSVLFGIYQPNGGYIKVNGKQVTIHDPKYATSLGISMVHQHFKLVDVYNAVENIVLGREDRKGYIYNDLSKSKKKIQILSKQFGLNINFKTKVSNMPIGMQQRVEILKMLYSKADILIFDEPTAVLSPKEINGFLRLVKNFQKQGKTVILITHKLEEIKEIANNATIIRRGKVVGSCDVKKTTVKKMAAMMVGKEIINVKNKFIDASKNNNILKVENLTVIDHDSKKKTLNNVSFHVNEGEIVAIAGVEGNGQSELALAISGLTKSDSGSIWLSGYNLTKSSIRRRYEKGLSHIPEDRHKYGLILDMTIKDNMSSQIFYKHPFSKYGIIKNGPANDFSLGVVYDFDVRGSNNGDSISRSLSGGNQQKAIVGREMKKPHNLLMAVQPTRGLDLGAISNIHDAILIEKQKKKGILLISYELDEILSLADRVIVFNDGKITGELNAKNITRNKVGEFMAKREVDNA